MTRTLLTFLLMMAVACGLSAPAFAQDRTEIDSCEALVWEEGQVADLLGTRIYVIKDGTALPVHKVSKGTTRVDCETLKITKGATYVVNAMHVNTSMKESDPATIEFTFTDADDPPPPPDQPPPPKICMNVTVDGNPAELCSPEVCMTMMIDGDPAELCSPEVP